MIKNSYESISNIIEDINYILENYDNNNLNIANKAKNILHMINKINNDTIIISDNILSLKLKFIVCKKLIIKKITGIKIRKIVKILSEIFENNIIYQNNKCYLKKFLYKLKIFQKIIYSYETDELNIESIYKIIDDRFFIETECIDNYDNGDNNNDNNNAKINTIITNNDVEKELFSFTTENNVLYQFNIDILAKTFDEKVTYNLKITVNNNNGIATKHGKKLLYVGDNFRWKIDVQTSGPKIMIYVKGENNKEITWKSFLTFIKL